MHDRRSRSSFRYEDGKRTRIWLLDQEMSRARTTLVMKDANKRSRTDQER